MESVFDRLRGNNEEGGKISQGISDFFYDVKEHKTTYKSLIIVSPIGGILTSGWACQMVAKLFGRQDKIYLAKILIAWINTPGIILAALVCIFLLMGGYRFHKVTKKDYYVDREGNFLVSKQGLHGKAHWQTEKEREQCFNRSKDIEDLLGDILGMDDEGRLYTLREDLVGINRNKCIFGTPGSGKSAAIIENDILQCIRRGESAIITDSKGDLYRRLSQKARDAGYVVKVLNLKSNELKNSDAFHLLKYLENGDTSVAEMLANCIIENTGDGHMDYWAQNEMNGYKALLLYISTSETLKATGRNTLAEMYNICTQNTPAGLATMFNALPKTHPARQAFNIFANCEPKVQGQILNGMGIKLSFLTDFYAQQIVSHDEIDLILPMKKKCMYFVVIPDTNKTYNVIANLFFNMMLIKQCEYSDSLTTKQKEDQLFVNYILDEFKATGAINNFDGTITTVRSRKVGITTVLQTLGQLKDMYPGEAYNTILGSMTVKILLRAGDEDTGRYFNVACGTQTRLNKAARYSDTLGETIHTHNSETITEGLIGADLVTIDDTQKLDANKLIVTILGFEPVKLNKYLSKYNPYMQGCEEHERVPGRHKPLWRKRMEDAEKAKAEERKKYRESSEVEVSGTAEEMQPSEVVTSSQESGEFIPEQTVEPAVKESILDRFDTNEGLVAPGLPEASEETPAEEPKKAAPKRRSKFTQVTA